MYFVALGSVINEAVFTKMNRKLMNSSCFSYKHAPSLPKAVVYYNLKFIRVFFWHDQNVSSAANYTRLRDQVKENFNQYFFCKKIKIKIDDILNKLG